jgi:hypothetical protein
MLIGKLSTGSSRTRSIAMTKLSPELLKLAKNRKEAARGAIKFFSKSFLGIETHKGIKTVKSANNPFDGLSKSQKNAFYRDRNQYLGRKTTFDEYKYVSTYDYASDEDFCGFVRDGEIVDDIIPPPDGVLMRSVSYQYEDSLLGSVAQTMRTGMGNCDEKGRIVYASLVGNPRLTDGKSAVTLVSSNNLVKVKKVKNIRNEAGKKVRTEVEVEKEMGYDHVFVIVADTKIGDDFIDIKDLGPVAMVVDGWTQDWYFPNLSKFDAVWYGLGNPPNPRQAVVRRNVKNNRTRAYALSKDGVSDGQTVGVQKFF